MTKAHAMDINIPSCALRRRAGTVVVRIKIDQHNSGSCQDFGRTHHRTSVCEQCTRTRLNSYSDCDSDLVQSCRPYRTSAARSRYVNVCAAVCLLLLVGGLSPQSTAAPHWSRNMDRQKRESGTQENRLWGDPCDDATSLVSNAPLKYTPTFANKAAAQARNTVKLAQKYKDTFALKVFSVSSFENSLKDWSDYEWLRKFPGIKEKNEILPKEKIVGQQMPDAHISNMMSNIDEFLPGMYKGLKIVVAGLNIISSDSEVITDEKLRQNIVGTMHSVRAVLCIFKDIMRSRNLPIEPLADAELNEYTKAENSSQKMEKTLLVYRDSINYLEYLAQVFNAMYETIPEQA